MRLLVAGAVAALLCVLLLAAGVRVAIAPNAVRPAAGVAVRPAVRWSELALPVQAEASSALGERIPGYQVRAGAEGLAVSSPTQRLTARFGTHGVEVSWPGGAFGMRLDAVGSGRALTPLAEDNRPVARANRVSYRFPGLTESYSNGPAGLEQSFTIERPPGRAAGGKVDLVLALSAGPSMRIRTDRRGVVIARPGRLPAHYDGLRVTDARGKVMKSWITYSRDRLTLHIVARGAHYPVRVDPFVQVGEPLFGAGYSVALSEDGNTAIVGDPGAPFVPGSGRALVYTRSAGTWDPAATELSGGAESENTFGYSVALSADGDTAMVGGPLADSAGGEVWTFKREGGSWKPFGTPLRPASAERWFGASVALSAVGTTALVGAPREGGGSVWAFVEEGNAWTQQGLRLKSRGAGEKFGQSVALSKEGSTALIGAPEANGDEGAAYVYTRSLEEWQPQAGPLDPGDSLSPYEQFGASVALSSDGNTALISGPYEGESPENHTPPIGAAWVFTRSGSTWSQQGPKITGTGEVERGKFGSSVSLSGDGNTALIGAPSGSSGGGAWLFRRTGDSWSQLGAKIEGSGQPTQFGEAVALSRDGSTGMITGIHDVQHEGAAWSFAPEGPSVAVTGSASVSETTATIDGIANPEGYLASAYVEYGPTAAYGSITLPEELGYGEANTPVTSRIANLMPNTTYHFRIVAVSSAGRSQTSDQTLTTLPLPPPPPAPPPPVNTSPPAILGRPIVGRAVAVSAGAWAHAPSSFAYQWQLCTGAAGACVAIPGATSSAYTVGPGTLGDQLRVVVTAANAGGVGAGTSGRSATVGSVIRSSMSWRWGFNRHFTVVDRLVVKRLPAGATVQLFCKGRGCPFGHARAGIASGTSPKCRRRRCPAHRRVGPSEVDLAKLFKGSRLGLGADITVEVTKPYWVGIEFGFVTRRGAEPTNSTQCLAPGSSQAGVGC
jgi:hypothetical protein